MIHQGYYTVAVFVPQYTVYLFLSCSSSAILVPGNCCGEASTCTSSERTPTYAFGRNSISAVSQLIFSACADLFHPVCAATTSLGNSRSGGWNPGSCDHDVVLLSICAENSTDSGKGDRTA